MASVRNLLIDRPGGGHVRLGEVADVRVARRRPSIQRDAVSRYLDVEADVSGRSLDAVANDIEDRLADVEPPARVPRGGAAGRRTGEEINPAQMLAFAHRCADRDLPAAAGGLPELAPGGAGRS